MSAAPNLRPEQMLAYFENLTRQQPDVQGWVDGARLSRRWIELTALPEVELKAIESLMREISARPEPGSGFIDLWLRVATWARAMGVAVRAGSSMALGPCGPFPPGGSVV